MRKRRVHHQLRLSDDVWADIKRVRLHLESRILATDGVAAHVSPDEALRLLLAEQGLHQGQLSEKDQRYFLHVMRIIRRDTPDASSSDTSAAEAP